MKGNIEYRIRDKIVKKEITYIPVRYVFAVIITVLEILTILAIMVGLCIYVPYFYLATFLTEIFCVINIVASDSNPDYKIPWMLFVLILPIVGFMLYFLFYSRKLKKRYIKRLNALKEFSYDFDDELSFQNLKRHSTIYSSHAKTLCALSGAHLFENTAVKYFSTGESMFESMMVDLKTAQKFIYLEYFIVEEGKMWNSILDILIKKAKNGVEIKFVYDDIGCMTTLPGDYYKRLKKHGIEATPFSRLKGNADSEFNNRNHRKILVIDGKVGYTGGINIADEYINAKVKHGHWKDGGIRLEGQAVKELTQLFIVDFGINTKALPNTDCELYPNHKVQSDGFVLPFGDGPRPLYNRCVGKTAIQNMLSTATRYVYITTPYLVIDNELCCSIENAALRGVEVKIIVPHIPDKKMVFGITRSYYPRLMDAGVKIYEYEIGFIHCKNYISDDVCAMVGTINLDYRSLVHHFENGVWLYGSSAIKDMKSDFNATLKKCFRVDRGMIKVSVWQRLIRSVVRIFAPLL